MDELKNYQYSESEPEYSKQKLELGKEISLIREIERISIFNDDSESFISELNKKARVILQESEIVLKLMNTKAKYEHYVINSLYQDDYHSYFRIPFRIEEDDDDFDLVFRASDFALQGIIIYEEIQVAPWVKLHYYYFIDATITKIEGMKSNNKINNYANYEELMKNHGNLVWINWESIVDSFSNLFSTDWPNLSRVDFLRIIIATVETLRFREVEDMIRNSTFKQYTWSDFKQLVMDWNYISDKAASYLRIVPESPNFPGSKSVYIYALNLYPIIPVCSINSSSKNVCIENRTRVLDRYLNQNQTELSYYKGWDNGETLSVVHNISLGNNSPRGYSKIEFFSDNGNPIYSKASWGGDAYPGKTINELVKPNFQNFILSGDYTRRDIRAATNLELLNAKEWDGSAVAKMRIYSGISYYWDERTKQWYLQILTWMYGESWASASGGGLWINYGNRLRMSR